MHSKKAVVVIAALTLCCANEENENPFAAIERTRPIPSWADIILTSNLHAPSPDTPRELFAVSSTDGRVEQLTFPASGSAPRDYCQVAPIYGTSRVLLIERAMTSNPAYPTNPTGAVIFLDLTRGVRVELVPQENGVSSVDTSRVAESVFAFSAHGAGEKNDLYSGELNEGTARFATITSTTDVSEDRPRVDPSGTFLTYARTVEDSSSEIWILISIANEYPITSGSAGTETLPSSSYRIGSDTDPCFSPSLTMVAFRRLTAIGDGRLGEWDVLTASSSSTGDGEIVPIAQGPVYRGAPDWGPSGIVFTEWDPTTAQWSLVVVNDDSSNRRTPLVRSAPARFDSPRWIR